MPMYHLSVSIFANGYPKIRLSSTVKCDGGPIIALTSTNNCDEVPSSNLHDVHLPQKSQTVQHDKAHSLSLVLFVKD